MRILIALLLSVCALAARATPQHRDATGLWINPDESGWGLNLFHQGDTIFGSLFVYGPDGRARWYTASKLTGPDAGPSYYQASVYTGELYESTGPGIGGAFDPARVTRRRVGSMTFDLGAGVNERNWGHVVYDIDGVRVDKMVYPFAFARMNLSGTYVGYRGQPGSPYCACPRTYEEFTATITQNASVVSMTTVAASGSCVYTGSYQANGHLANVMGNYSCTNGAGGFQLLDLDVTPNGITSRLYDNKHYDSVFGGVVATRTSGAVRGDGSKTDLWWNPAESGWGVNIIEQGDTLFATMFVYDAEGRPHWYSASNLAYGPGAPPDAASDSKGRYAGALQESTGPYFGTSFNPSAVTRREVGTMTIEFFGSDTAYLDYNVNGVTTVSRKQLQRAALRANSLAGSYSGHIVLGSGNNDRGVQTGAMTFENSDTADAVTIAMRGSRGQCTLRAARPQVTQAGHIVSLAGDYDCGGARIGRMEMYDVEVNWPGFTGAVSLDGYPIGRIEGLRTTMH
jgi:hypothetical protein